MGEKIELYKERSRKWVMCACSSQDLYYDFLLWQMHDFEVLDRYDPLNYADEDRLNV